MRRFRTAIVIIHGFTGNLYDNEYLANYLELNPLYDVYAKTLPGHNKDRFSNATKDDFIKSVDDEIKNLIDVGYKKIYVIGHSMGGILATYLAGKYKEIKKIVLVNAAFLYANTKQSDGEESKWRILFDKVMRTSPSLFREFTKLVKDSKKYLKDVWCDTLILRSMKDEVVPREAADLIYNSIPSNKKYLTDIKDARHTVLSSNKKENTSIYIEQFLKGGRIWKKNMKKEI